ncbi:unnamed protein product [Commensalibacter communis]|nr:unnamed protein product [Commensalibacter communis]CAI3950772.1 unnamed protein product [Commensalibacter communis]
MSIDPIVKKVSYRMNYTNVIMIDQQLNILLDNP